MIRFLSDQLRGFRALLVAAVGMTFAQVAADVLGALPIKWVLDKVVNHANPTFPGFGALVGLFDSLGDPSRLGPGELHTETAVIVLAGVMFVVFGLASAILTFAQMRSAVHVAQHLSSTLRRKVFGQMLALPLDWHGRQRTGDLVQRVTGNIADIEKLVTDGLVDLLSGMLTLLGIVAVMAALNWRFTVVAVVVIPALFVVVWRFTLAIKAATRLVGKASARLTDLAAEDIRAITEVKAFGLEAYESERFAARAGDLRSHASRAGKLQAIFTPLVLLVVAIATACIVTIGGIVASGRPVSLAVLTIPAGSLTIGTLAVFLAYLKQLYQPMRNLSKLANMAAMASTGIERVSEILTAKAENIGDGSNPTGALRGRIRFEHVAFEYNPGEPVLVDIDLDINPGQRVALVGLSGSGKTTIAKLIARFHDVTGGVISIDGHDVRSMPLAELRRNISFVPQDSVLFEGTIRDNLVLGRTDVTEADLERACGQAHILDTIQRFPDGFDSIVREAGKNLSTGQRQRLAIARAILRDAPILLLDEPTASLDVEAESEVMHALDALIQGRTVLMISHRLSTLGNVHEIVVLKDGRIAERGSPAKLLAAGGIYASMVAEQARYSATRSTIQPNLTNR